MQTDTQAQLNITDLIHLADLKDLIAVGKKAEAMPALYSLASKYPQNIEIQDLIRASLNPVYPLPTQQTSQPTQNSTQLPPQPKVTSKKQTGYTFILNYLGFFMLCNLPLIAISVIISLTTQSSTSAINNCKTVSCMKAYSPPTQTQMTIMLIPWLVIFALTIASSIWTIIDAILIAQKHKNPAIGIVALVSILLLGGWVFGFPLYLTYRRRTLSQYKT